ncbi:MAG: NTP transferase domain-containing protein [Deferrisomatales bacterium]
MRAVILSAGQGRRLLPLTAERPKCALEIEGKTVVEWQVDHLLQCGVERVTVVVGYGAERVEELLHARYRAGPVQTLYNPFFAVSDNLGTCWVAREEMAGDFVLLNGDTLFEPEVVRQLLASPARPITLTSDRKERYDADDMKIRARGQRLLRVGKDLPPDQVTGESIGMILFRGEGPALFREAVEKAMRQQVALKRWYLSVIDRLAATGAVGICCIEGLDWAEIDCPEDLEQAREMIRGWIRRSPADAGDPPTWACAARL